MRCGRKFFNPENLFSDALGAGVYLRAKLDAHVCARDPKKTSLPISPLASIPQLVGLVRSFAVFRSWARPSR